MTLTPSASSVGIPCGHEQEIAENGHPVQGFGVLQHLEFGPAKASLVTRQALNQVLADTIVLYDLYRKCQWIVRGKGLYPLQQLLDQHAMQQLELIDLIIERVQLLGGVATTDSRRVAEMTTVSCPPNEGDELHAFLHWLLDIHEGIFDKVLGAIESSARIRIDRGNDPVLEDALRRHCQQAPVLATMCRRYGGLASGECCQIRLGWRDSDRPARH